MRVLQKFPVFSKNQNDYIGCVGSIPLPYKNIKSGPFYKIM